MSHGAQLTRGRDSTLAAADKIGRLAYPGYYLIENLGHFTGDINAVLRILDRL